MQVVVPYILPLGVLPWLTHSYLESACTALKKYREGGRITSRWCSWGLCLFGVGGSGLTYAIYHLQIHPRYQELISAQGGSTLNASVRSMVSIFNTNTAASTGILGWVLVDLIRYRGRFSLVGACEGAIAGLVGITPAAGFVSLWLAACIGFITSIICALLQDLNKWTRIDEGMDVFKLHGIGGMVGAFLTGIFASESVSGLDGATYQGGVIDGVGVQVGRHLAEVCAISGYAFVVSVLLLYLINWIPGMKLRVGEQVEGEGLDRGLLVEEIGDWGLFGMGVVEGAGSSGSSSPAQTQEMVVDAK